MNNANDRRLFWACFVALVTTAFAFVLRSFTADGWGGDFGLTLTQRGEILGAGLWPMAITIILFSLVVDKIGYGKTMVFAFLCHVASAVVVISASLFLAKQGATPEEVTRGKEIGYWMLYIGYFIVALGNGTVEAVINPVVATMFPTEKPKWLNILHAGWPGGLVVGGMLALFLGHIPWQAKVGLILLPTVVYGIMMIGCKFPVNERVAAGVPYKDMLKEFGFFGALIVTTLLVFEVTRIMQAAGYFFPTASDDYRLYARLIISGIVAGAFGAYCGGLGRPILIFLLLIMIPLATTELGTDSWIGDLMKQPMAELQLDGGWILVYTSLIMMILRFFAGPIVHKLSPLGLLACSAAIAAIGLVALSKSTGIMILGAATLYGFGKTFFWPTMLGVVSEQFPKGGALTLNATGGVGMLSVGVVGTVLLGFIQNHYILAEMKAQHPALVSQVTEERSVFGFKQVQVIDDKVAALSKPDKAGNVVLSAADLKAIGDVKSSASKASLAAVAIFPTVMLICYLLLIAYFRARGGYHAQVLTGHAAKDAEYTGGVAGPMEG